MIPRPKMTSELKYPVQPFVFEFAKEASKNLNFKDVYVKPSPNIDLSPLDQYLNLNGSFLDEFDANTAEQSQPQVSPVENCRLNDIFFDHDFDLKRTEIFNKVFPPNCLKKRLFQEELLLQLDAVQTLLLHSSDQQALEFFKSFSTIHDMHQELSILLPQVKGMRNDLKDLGNISESPEVIAKLRVQKERLNSLSEIVATMQKITNAAPAALAMADRQEYDAAFDLVDELIKLLPTLLGIKSLRSHMQKLKDTKVAIENKAKASFHILLTSEGSGQSMDIIDTLQKHNLIESAVSDAKGFIAEYAIEAVNKILNDSADQKGYKSSQLSVLSVHDFTEVLSAASPNIRSRILGKSRDSIAKLAKEFENRGIPSDGLTEISQTLVDRVFREITTIISSHPLKGTALQDFSALMEAMISISRSFDNFAIDTTLISASIITLGRSYVESFHNEQMKRLTQVLSQEMFVKKDPESVHVEIVKKLTSTDVNDLIIKNEHYGSTTSLLVLLEIIWGYWQAARKIPKTQDDITCKMCETIKLFSIQCHDLLLLGGKSHPTKMKTVSTKNLALSAAGICFVVNLLSYIKPRISAVGATSEVVNLQFNDVSKNLEHHLNQIIERIINGMSALISKCCVGASFTADQNSPFIVKIVQEINTLNKVFTECLPTEISTVIFKKIAEKMSIDISKAASGANKSFVQRDLDFLNDKLKACHCSVYIPGYTSSSSSL